MDKGAGHCRLCVESVQMCGYTQSDADIERRVKALERRLATAIGHIQVLEAQAEGREYHAMGDDL